jgi:hypothetical protein
MKGIVGKQMKASKTAQKIFKIDKIARNRFSK